MGPRWLEPECLEMLGFKQPYKPANLPTLPGYQSAEKTSWRGSWRL